MSYYQLSTKSTPPTSTLVVLVFTYGRGSYEPVCENQSIPCSLLVSFFPKGRGLSNEVYLPKVFSKAYICSVRDAQNLDLVLGT